VVTPCPARERGAARGHFNFIAQGIFFSGKERIKPRIMVCVFLLFFERLVGEREVAVIFWSLYYRKGVGKGLVGLEDAGRKGFDEGSLHCDS
jgi:hypothetical protein